MPRPRTAAIAGARLAIALLLCARVGAYLGEADSRPGDTAAKPKGAVSFEDRAANCTTEKCRKTVEVADEQYASHGLYDSAEAAPDDSTDDDDAEHPVVHGVVMDRTTTFPRNVSRRVAKTPQDYARMNASAPLHTLRTRAHARTESTIRANSCTARARLPSCVVDTT